MAKGARPVFSTAVGKKIVMALTGLAMCIYLITHLAGNLVLLIGSQKFNAFAHTLTSIPIVPLIEIGLLAVFLMHIYDGIKVSIENRNARPVRYHTRVWARNKSDKSRKTTASTTMMWSGIVILVFVFLHVWHFKYGPHYPEVGNISTGTGTIGVATSQPTTPQEAHAQVRDLAYLVITEFKKPWIMALYMVSMVALGLHLYHAVSSAFQSLGVSNEPIRRAVYRGGQLFTLVIAGGFTLLPLWVYLFVPTPPPRDVIVSTISTQDNVPQSRVSRSSVSSKGEVASSEARR